MSREPRDWSRRSVPAITYLERTSIEWSLTLPREKDLDRILRYETANERALTRALDRLERLQRLRKGEYVPAPVTVTLEGPLNGNSEN